MIENMYPNRKYLELFARKQYSDKWTAWGNEVNKIKMNNNDNSNNNTSKKKQKQKNLHDCPVWKSNNQQS